MPKIDPAQERELTEKTGSGAEMTRNDPDADRDEDKVKQHLAAQEEEEEENFEEEDEEEEDDEEYEEDEDEEEDDEDDDTPKGGRMTILDHLAELRKRILTCAGVFLVAVILCMSRAEWFVNQMLTRGSQFSFVYISPAELLMTYVRVAIIGGIVVAVPVIIYEIWRFLSPGLRRKEQIGFFAIMTLGLCLFVLGAVFSFAIVLPILLAFFARLETANTVQAMVSVQEYVSYVVSNMVTFGIIFETPIVVVTLTGIGIVKPRFLRKNFKFVVLLILVVAAIITPPDITSQLLVGVPLMVLFYASILLSQIIFRKKLARERALYGDDEDEEE